MLARALWLCVLVLTAGPLLADDDAPVRYDNWKVVEIRFRSGAQIDEVHALGAILLSEDEGVGPVKYVVPPAALPGLDRLGLTYTILNDNVQKGIDEERAIIEARREVDGRDPAWFTAYKDLAAVNAKLNQMIADRPDLCSLLDIGTSLQNRHIYGIRITGPGEGKPAVLFNGCHHAREWISVMVPMWIADKLVYEYDTNPQIHDLVNAVEFFIVPVVNPDGYVYTWTNDRLWRKNRRLNSGGCYGVDDNRNYAAGWGGSGSSGDPCSETYRGTAAFSEPETAAMRDFYLAHPQIAVTMSYHSYSQLILSPYGYTSALPPDHELFMEMNEAQHDAILAVHGMQYDYGPIYSTIYPVGGGDVDWIYDETGAFSFTIELRDTGQYGFELPPAQIIPTCEENFPAALYLAEWASSPVKISFPSGQPVRLAPDTPEPLTVKIKVVGGTLDTDSLRLYTRLNPAVPFTEHTLTPLGGDLYQATLPATPCGRTLYYYISAATTTGIVGTAPANAPDATFDVDAPPIVTIYSRDMSTNPSWTLGTGWGYGDPTGGGSGNHDPQTGHTGTNVVGYNLYGDYSNNMPERHATTGAINCSGYTGVRLSFWRWLGVESSQYDHAYVRVSNNGTTYTNVWSNPSSSLDDGQWVYQEFDISALADNRPAVYLRWTMGTSDGYLTYCGWNVDDVVLSANDPAGCPAVIGDLNCDGEVGFGDINPFVTALVSPDQYVQLYPACDINLADVNGDGTVGFADINPFVGLLTGL